MTKLVIGNKIQLSFQVLWQQSKITKWTKLERSEHYPWQILFNFCSYLSKLKGWSNHWMIMKQEILNDIPKEAKSKNLLNMNITNIFIIIRHTHNELVSKKFFSRLCSIWTTCVVKIRCFRLYICYSFHRSAAWPHSPPRKGDIQSLSITFSTQHLFS